MSQHAANEVAKDLLGVVEDDSVGQNEIMAADGAYSYRIAGWRAEYY